MPAALGLSSKMHRDARNGRPKLGALAITILLTLMPVGGTFAQQRSPNQALPTTRPAQIDRDSVLMLIRSTLLALNQANQTGNYTVLRDLSSPGFRDANTAARLGEIFARERALKLEMSSVAVFEPHFTLAPQIESSGLMRVAGFFPFVPAQLNFELLFTLVDRRWQLFGIAVNSAPPTIPAHVQPQGSAQQPAMNSDSPKSSLKQPGQ
ncbi:hypothetical protein [Methylobacterium sp. WL103]|uniref:hypothetical protein n=1 Tax=Methylobacterium sp. WL103 TaxID=2603891 RepID=UPI0011CC06E8